MAKPTRTTQLNSLLTADESALVLEAAEYMRESRSTFARRAMVMAAEQVLRARDAEAASPFSANTLPNPFMGLGER